MLSPESPRKIILQIDGSIGHRAELERAVSRVRPGTIVHSLSDGPAALEHLALCGSRYPVPNLVLLSRALPGELDGYAVLQRVRALAHLQALPVILVHSDHQPDEVTRAQDLGASGYLLKPAEKGKYVEFARAILAEGWSQVRPAPAGNRLVSAGGVTGSSAVTALSSAIAPFAAPGADHSVALRLLGYLDQCKEEARRSVDPFYLAFSEACRRHHLRPAQAMQRDGSHRLIANRRAVMIDLLVEGWPDETLCEVLPVSKTELKRLHLAARTKVGAKVAPLIDQN